MSLKIEAFLNRIDQEISGLNALDKANIIKEIEASIQDGLNNNSDETSVIKSLGSAKDVAKIYMAKRGIIKQNKNSISKFIKSMLFVIGIIITVMLIIFGLTVWKLNPVITMSDHGMSFLGGAIEMNDDGISVGIGNKEKREMATDKHNDEHTSHNSSWSHRKTIDDTEPKEDGSALIDLATTKQIKIIFDNGHYSFSLSDSNNLSWKCAAKHKADSKISSSFEENILAIKSGHNQATCEINIPKDLGIQVEGKNGVIYLNKPYYNAKILLENGIVELNMDKALEYKYDLHIKNGIVPNFGMSTSPNAYIIEVSIDNGMIAKK